MTRKPKSKPDKDSLETLLPDAAKHLLNRILNPTEGDVMTVAEEAQAFKAVSAYWGMTRRLNAKDGNGSFNGALDTIAGLEHGRGARANSAAATDYDDPFGE